MLGAIIGDISGSRFEWKNLKSKKFELLTYQVSIVIFLNGTTCQKREISDGKRSQNDNRAPVSVAVRSSLTGTGAFLFCFSGEVRRSNDAGIRHNHRAQALVFRGLGAEPTNKLFAIRPGLHCLPLSTRLFLMNGLLFHLSKTIWCYTEHLLEAADELPRITIADLITNLTQFPVFRFQQFYSFSQFEIFDRL